MALATEQMISRGPVSPPAPTTPPHPRELLRRLDKRQAYARTCGWVDGEEASAVTCSIGDACAQDTINDIAFCCDTILDPLCATYATGCFDSTEVSSSCTGLCLYNTAILKCTRSGFKYCATKKFNRLTLDGLLTNYDCAPAPLTYTAFDFYISSSSTITVDAISRLDVTVPPSPTSSRYLVGPTPDPSPSRGGLSGGAIAGIVVGCVVVIGGLLLALALFLFYKYKKGKQPKTTSNFEAQPVASIVDTASSPTVPPTESSRPTITTTASTQPLTHAAMSEISPNDSASQIGGFCSPQGSHNAAPHQEQFAGPGTQGARSSLGTLPQFQQQNPNIHGGLQGPQSSVMTPGSAFGSMPPGRAPDVPSPGHERPTGAAEMH